MNPDPATSRHIILPDWPAPSKIKACTTTRYGGVSSAPFDSMNLADHVGDSSKSVRENRLLLRNILHLPSAPCWLRQEHGHTVVSADNLQPEPLADGSYSSVSGAVCAILTADCLPILLCRRDGSCIAALHAGWRGMANGIIAAGLEKMCAPGDDVIAWLGPAISATSYEVDDSVRDSFLDIENTCADGFRSTRPGHWYADLYQLARILLDRSGVSAVYGGKYCTYQRPEKFFSYRRDGICGRMATLIWIEP